MELNLDFTDITMSETEGVYEEVNKTMLLELPNNKWMIRTNIVISSCSGIGEMTIQCYYDKKIIIMEYSTMIKDVYYNPDIQAISLWAQQKEWDIPQPSVDLITTNKKFWKHFYDTLIIDSDYFDKHCGKRPQLEE